MKMSSVKLLLVAFVATMGLFAQSLNYSGTPALLNQVTLSMHGVPNQPYILAASDNPGPTVIAPLGAFELGYPPILVAGAIPGFPAVPALDASGNMSMTFSIPFLSSLIGTSWWFQGVYFDPTSPYGLSKTNGTHFTIADPLLAPTITSVTPNSGPAAGGTQVAIIGTNFLPGGTTISVGAKPLMNPVVATPTLILGTIPPGTPGASADLTVSTIVGGSAVLADGFTYLGNSAPLIASVTPDHAPISGGGIFTLTGQGLGNGTTVYLNGMPCIALSQSPTSYVGIIPNTTTPGYATLVAASTAGVATLSNVFRYTIVLDVGNGSDGVFNPTSNVLIDTTINGGIFNYTSFTIPAGVTVTARGPNPLVIKCTGDVNILGTLDLKGEDAPTTLSPNGSNSILIPSSPTYGSPSAANAALVRSALVAANIVFPVPGAGGGAGGDGSSSGGFYFSAGSGTEYAWLGRGLGSFSAVPSIFNGSSSQLYNIGPSHGTMSFSPSAIGNPTLPMSYGSPDLTPVSAGSGGMTVTENYSQGGSLPWLWVRLGAAGGGAVDVRASGQTFLSGVIDVRGGFGLTLGECASAGGVRISSQSNIVLSYTASILLGGAVPFGGAGQAGNGRWAIQSWNGTKSNGTTPSIPAGVY